jgi:hypothetical protein
MGPIDPKGIDERAEALRLQLNAIIVARCAESSPCAWQTIAEQEASDALGDQWEWLIVAAIGRPPAVMVTRYLGPVR